MEIDETLALELLRGSSGPALRVYQWAPWAVSLGLHQNERDVNTEACAADGVDIVRRPTGGRAILHAEELTYAVVMRAGGKSVHEVYQSISTALLEGLRLYGVPADFRRSQANFGVLYRGASSVSCFSSSARYEIEWSGRKLVGSAQRRYGTGDDTVVLQHGSILCGPAHQEIAKYLHVAGEEVREGMRRELREKTACIRDVTGDAVDIGRLATCVRRGFEQAWGIRFGESSVITETGNAYA
jgi:lipoate-protein ligase A